MGQGPEGRRGRVALGQQGAGPQTGHVPRKRASGHRLQVDRDEGRFSHARRVGDGAGRTGRAGGEHDRRFGRPVEFGQDRRLPEKDQSLHEGRFQRQILPGRRVGADDGLHHERYGTARRRDSGLRHLLRLLGLHEAGRTPLGTDAPARDLYLDARLVPRRRGRPDAPADRARGADSPDGAPAQPRGRAVDGRAASRRRRGDDLSMASRSRRETPRGAHPLASEHQEPARAGRKPPRGGRTARQGRLHRRRHGEARRSDGRFGFGGGDARRRCRPAGSGGHQGPHRQRPERRSFPRSGRHRLARRAVVLANARQGDPTGTSQIRRLESGR